MADTSNTSNHVPILEAAQPPTYKTSIPETLVAQITVIAFVALIILGFLTWAEMPPVATGFAIGIFVVLIGLAIYNGSVMRSTSGTETKHILEIRNDELAAQNATAMYAMSQNNEVVTEAIKHMVSNATQNQGFQPMAAPIQGQFTRSASLRQPTTSPKLTGNNTKLLEFDDDS